MRQIIDRGEIEEIQKYLRLAADEALNSNCKKSPRGVIIINNDEIIGRGHNRAMNSLADKYCNPCIRENIKDNTQMDLCPAVHAEMMAILEAEKEKLPGSTMYHIKVKSNELVPSGKPSCSPCSKLISLSGIKELILWHDKGYFAYKSNELIGLSIDYFLKED